MNNRPLRILHISDLHERAEVRGTTGARKAKLAWDAEQRGRVLGASFLEILATDALDGIDLVLHTGDVADTGHPAEYTRAAQRIDTILNVVKVPRNRFFAIPGNHDVRRPVAEAAWRGVRRWVATNKSDSALQSLGRWVFGGAAPTGIEQIWRSEVVKRTAAFWKWLQTFTGNRFPQSASLGYRHTIDPDLLPHVAELVHIVGLDSAWLCGADEAQDDAVLTDQGNLLLTEAQVDRHTRDGARALDGYRIVLIHHPLE
jgi:3',5'-cyclic AMP phosphodiesterase CpdA